MTRDPSPSRESKPSSDAAATAKVISISGQPVENAGKCYGKLEQILELELVRDPDRPTLPRVARLVDKILELLDLGRIIEIRNELHDLDHKIRKKQDKLDGLRRRQLLRPAGSFGRDKSRFKERITVKLRDNIAEFRAERERKLLEVAAEARAIGIELDDEQVELFLSAATGETVMELANLFDKVKRLAEQLRLLAAHSDEDNHSARRYYGMHVMLVLILVRAHRHALETLAEHGRRVERYREENDRLMERARQQQHQLRDEANRRLCGENLRAQQITDEACALHLQHLSDQSRQLEQSLQRLEERYAVTLDTLKTATLAAAVSDLITADIDTLSTLCNMQLPEMTPFRNDKLRQRYLEIAERVRQ
jgi:hypothetical protein